MKFCNRCLYHEHHPLGITFNEDGICSGCLVHEEKDKIDWSLREKKLKNILSKYKNKNGFDCIIPVSGSKDSYFIVHTIKMKYGLNPLLVTYNNQYNSLIGFRNLDYLKTVFDCDHISKTVNPKFIKKLTNVTFNELGSIYWHCIAGQTVFPVQVAVEFNIPLIIWGAHQGIDQVGMFSHLDEVEMTRKYRKEHDLFNYESEDIEENFSLKDPELSDFKYPSDNLINKVGVRGIYLNNFIRWDSKTQHEKMIDLYNYQSLDLNRNFNTYEDIESLMYTDFHDYLKFLKHGYSKVTDHASIEIRLKRMNREEGIKIVNKYQNNKLLNLDYFADWIGIEKDKLLDISEKFRNKKLWQIDANGKWKLKFSPSNNSLLDVNKMRLDRIEDTNFINTKFKSNRNLNKMNLYARGF